MWAGSRTRVDVLGSTLGERITTHFGILDGEMGSGQGGQAERGDNQVGEHCEGLMVCLFVLSGSCCLVGGEDAEAGGELLLYVGS